MQLMLKLGCVCRLCSLRDRAKSSPDVLGARTGVPEKSKTFWGRRRYGYNALQNETISISAPSRTLCPGERRPGDYQIVGSRSQQKPLPQERTVCKHTREEGFTIIEAMISVLILTIALIGTVSLQATFGSSASNRMLHTCLMDAASSALSQCQAGITPDSAGTCPEGDITPSVSLSGSCSPSLNTCSVVTATTTARGKTFRLTSTVCNLQ